MTIADQRISRFHLRLEPHPYGWQAIDTSTNGLYVDGVRRTSVAITRSMILHLGDAAGIPLVVTPSDSHEAAAVLGSEDGATERVATGDDNTDIADIIGLMEPTDPDIARAGRAVAARRRELSITQRRLAREKIINAGTLIAFEKGRS